MSLRGNSGDAVLAQHLASNKNYRLGQQQLQQDDRQFNQDLDFRSMVHQNQMSGEDADRYLQAAQLELTQDATEKDRMARLVEVRETLQQKKLAELFKSGATAAKAKPVSATREKAYFTELEKFETRREEYEQIQQISDMDPNVVKRAVGPGSVIKVGISKLIGTPEWAQKWGVTPDENTVATARQIENVLNFITVNRTQLIAGPKSDKDIELIESTNLDRGMTPETFTRLLAAVQRRSKKIMSRQKQKLYNMNPQGYEQDFGAPPGGATDDAGPKASIQWASQEDKSAAEQRMGRPSAPIDIGAASSNPFMSAPTLGQ